MAAKPYGLLVESVGPGTWAERSGLSSGDVLLTIAGAPLYSVSDLGIIERITRSGEQLTATWGHNSERVEATATV